MLSFRYLGYSITLWCPARPWAVPGTDAPSWSVWIRASQMVFPLSESYVDYGPLRWVLTGIQDRLDKASGTDASWRPKVRGTYRLV